MKPAIFQVNQPDGVARLMCIYLPSMRSALDLQACLRKSHGRNHIELLGRFDRIQIATSIHEAVTIALELQGAPGSAIPNWRAATWRTGIQRP
jgi:hypothetical protein